MPQTLKVVPGGIAPHGGALEIRMAADNEIESLKKEASGLPTIEATSRRILSDLELLATGAVSPNRGFMTKADYESVVNEMRLANGLPWSLPITLAPTEAELAKLVGHHGHLGHGERARPRPDACRVRAHPPLRGAPFSPSSSPNRSRAIAR